MPPLDRAVALAEKEHRPVRIGENLRLDVPRILEVALDVHRVVREVLQALPLRGLERASPPPEGSATSSMPLPPPPAAALMISG